YGDSFGSVVGPVGDVNSDGVPDFAVSVGNSLTGIHVNVHSGADGTLLYSVADETAAYDAILPLADINGDHTPDFVVSFRVSSRSSFRAVSRADGSSIYVASCSRSKCPSRTLLIALGDINGDDIPDFVEASLNDTD